MICMSKSHRCCLYDAVVDGRVASCWKLVLRPYFSHARTSMHAVDRRSVTGTICIPQTVYSFALVSINLQSYPSIYSICGISRDTVAASCSIIVPCALSIVLPSVIWQPRCPRIMTNQVAGDVRKPVFAQWLLSSGKFDRQRC